MYLPFDSFVHTTFWHKLSQIKLDVDKLEENSRKIWGCYSCTSPPGLCSVNVDCSSFNSEYEEQKLTVGMYGTIINKNTLESFKEFDKQKLLQEQGEVLLKDISNGDVLNNPSLLARFLLLTFADLKKCLFYYWFAFPAINIPPVTIVEKGKIISTVLNDLQIKSLQKEYFAINDWKQRPYFIVEVHSEQVKLLPLKEIEKISDYLNECGDVSAAKYYLSFSDPSNLTAVPGWPLRNLLAMVSLLCPNLCGKPLSILALRLSRNSDNAWSAQNSFCVTIQLIVNKLENVSWLGWQRNTKGKFGPRSANLSDTMDPVKLAEASVNLNLKLMKWRIVPDLDLDLVQNTKCLLLGSGTLGCAVARTLLAWGIHSITIVDSGCVSFSNPVRQSLFTYEDCLNGGVPKAETAAKALQRIFPGVNSSGFQLQIPMPGHSVSETVASEVEDIILKLENLIEEHDVIFLLMDSRESRWLPTLIASSKKKFVINAALGFDTFLVMRHGMHPPKDTTGWSGIGQRLGCYFCNDITAPGNTQSDRTLDQQCTVTRPGISTIAASLAVELMVAVLQHPLRGYAPAEEVAGEHKEHQTENQSVLGLVPHSIRGFLGRFEQVMCLSYAFKNCVACSEKVVDEYEKEGIKFLMLVFNTPRYLEDLTGLVEIQKQSENAEVWEYSDFSLSDESE